MISTKYKDVYDVFINNYESIHLDPWHDISKEEIAKVYNDLINNMEVDNLRKLAYVMNHIIKLLCGRIDAHTRYGKDAPIPMLFRIYDDEVLVKYPDELKGSKLISINNIPINQIFDEMEYVITYGTEGRKIAELERGLTNKFITFSLPSLVDHDDVTYNFIDVDGNRIDKTFNFYYDTNIFTFENMNKENATYEFRDNVLIYHHSSADVIFADRIKEAIDNIRKEDLSNIDTIIIDLKNNGGGSAKYSQPIFDFLDEHKDKKLIVLTNYRIFSNGRFDIVKLKKRGAITIGEGISTPMNAFGNNKYVATEDNKHKFVISSAYNNPLGRSPDNKEDYKEQITKDILEPIIFKPDIEVKQTKEDFINGVDTILEYALEYSKNNKKRM